MRGKFLPLLVLIFIGCSSEEISIANVAPPQAVSFIAIGEDQDAVYQYSFNAETKRGSNFNLTAELGITKEYVTFRRVGDLLSFYSYSDGKFSLANKNVSNGQINSYNDFYEIESGRSVAWGINNDNNAFFAFFGPNGSRDLNIQDIQLVNNQNIDILIDVDIERVYQPLLNQNKIYFSYLDNSGNTKFSFYNTESKTAGPKLNFGTSTISFFANNNGTISILKNGTNPSLEIFDGEDLQLIESFTLSLNASFNLGPINGMALQDNKLHYAKPLAQPARFPFGPAVFDLITAQDSTLSIEAILAESKPELATGFSPTFQTFDTASQQFLIGYSVITNEIRGGVLQITSEGIFVDNIEFPFYPTNIIVN